MKHRLPSLSKSALMLSPCLSWTRPDARHYADEFTDTTKRDRGTQFHLLIANYIQGKPVVLDGLDGEMLSWFQQAKDYVDRVLGPRCDSIQAEVAIGVNWDTGVAKVLPGVKDREYPDEPGWTYGTADLVCILKDESLLVADWKTGGTEGAEFQLLSLACGLQRCVTQEFRKTSEHTFQVFRFVRTSCLKVSDNGIWPNEREVSNQELSIHWGAMRMVYQSAQDDPGPPYPGIHCTALYCPHLAFCGAVGGLVKDAAEGPQGKLETGWYRRDFRMTDRLTSDDHAGWVAERVSAAKRQLSYYEAALKDYVAKGGRAISGGWEWGPGPGGHRWRRSR